MKPALALAAALALTVAPAVAQAPTDPESLPAGVYQINSKDTLVRYGVIHMGLTDYWGTFPDATGTLTIDPKHVEAAKLSVKVPIATVETTNRELDAELFSDEFFDGEHHHFIQFVSTRVTRTGPRTADVAGDLSMHGVTRPVVLHVTFNGAGPNAFSNVLTLGFKAEGVVKRSDFGMGKYVPIVSDETSIFISAALEKQ